MAQWKRLKPVAWAAAGVLALGLVANLLLPPGSSGGVREPGQGREASAEATLTDAGAATEDGIDAQAESVLRRTIARARQPGGAVPAKQRPGPSTLEVTIPHDVVMDDYKRDLWAQIEANPPDLERLDELVIDADMAYRLYMYYGNCSVSPRTGSQADRQLERIENRVERAGGRYLDRLEGRVEDIIADYELCSLIPPEADARLEAVAWLSEAVRLGHGIAEAQFYEKAMGFILRPDRYTNTPPLALQHPGLVMEFKDTSRLAFSRALEKGHPEAYVAMSRAVLEGLVYPRDPVLAYAYAVRAELEARDNGAVASDAGYWKSAAEQYLDENQVAEARHLALEMHSTLDQG